MESSLTGKALVARRFARSGPTYDSAAIVQHDMAHQLVRLLDQVAQVSQFENVLELGCGTGLLTELLVQHFDIQHLTLNDIVPDLSGVALRCSSGPQDPEVSGIRFTLCPGDMESIQLPADQDLVTSNAVLQWATVPEAMLEKMIDAVKPGGLLAIATFGPDNLQETRDLTGRSLHYLSLNALHTELAARTEVLICKEQIRTISFESAYAMLKHLQRTGVNGLVQQPWSPRAVRKFCTVYESRFRAGNRVPLTYHPITVVARRREV